MHGTIASSVKRVTVQSDSKTVHIGSTDDQTDKDVDSGWFAEAMRDLSINAEMLRVLTDAELRTCYRYVSNERKPPGYLIVQLLRSEVGQQVLARLLGDAPWWQELQSARDLCAQFKIERK